MPIEIMYQIEGCTSIIRWFVEMSALVVTYVAYEENSLRYTASIYVTDIKIGEVAF